MVAIAEEQFEVWLQSSVENAFPSYLMAEASISFLSFLSLDVVNRKSNSNHPRYECDYLIPRTFL